MTYQSAVVERRIAAPVEHVWRLLTEPESGGGRPAVQRLTPGPLRAGSRLREARRVHGRTVTTELTVTGCVPGERYVVESGAGGGSYRLEYVLLSYVCEGDEAEGTAPVTAEGTLVRVTVRTVPPGRIGKLLAVMRARNSAATLRQSVAAELSAVAAACEQGREPAA